MNTNNKNFTHPCSRLLDKNARLDKIESPTYIPDDRV